jgi:hypothetical protein
MTPERTVALLLTKSYYYRNEMRRLKMPKVYKTSDLCVH